MGKVAVVFPGQGAQAVGMGKDFYEKFPVAKKMIDEINGALGFDLTKLMFEGPIEELTKTENTQPALVAVCSAILAVLEEKGFAFEAAAGHSLGEYSAYVASGKLDGVTAAKLVRKRGELMAKADPGGKGGMAAIMKAEDETVEKICGKYAQVVPANYNCPGQLVISGDKSELEQAYEELKAAGARVMPLNVSGPFHSPLMKNASGEFASFLKDVNVKAGKVPVYVNVTASPVPAGKEKDLLVEQIFSPVKWTQTIQNMIKDGFDTFVEIGPGSVLKGLIKKIDREVTVYNVDSVAALDSLDMK